MVIAGNPYGFFITEHFGVQLEVMHCQGQDNHLLAHSLLQNNYHFQLASTSVDSTAVVIPDQLFRYQAIRLDLTLLFYSLCR